MECITEPACHRPWPMGCSPPCFRSQLSWCVTSVYPFPQWPVSIPCPQIHRAPHRIFHATLSYNNMRSGLRCFLRASLATFERCGRYSWRLVLMVKQAQHQWMQLSIRSCLCSVHNSKSLQHGFWTTGIWLLEVSLSSSW